MSKFFMNEKFLTVVSYDSCAFLSPMLEGIQPQIGKITGLGMIVDRKETTALMQATEMGF
jgi:hypothetical protein